MIARRYSALAALAVLGLGACTSQPSTRTVAEEIIETLEGVPQDVKDCLAERLEGYTDDELEAIGEANPNFTSANSTIAMTPELEAFIADLEACSTGDAATDDTATDDTATDATTDGTASGEPSDTTTATTDA